MATVTLSQAKYDRLLGRAAISERLEKEVDLLKAMLRLMRLEKYGKRSEKLSDDQLELLELELGVKEAEVESEAQSATRKRPVKVREHAGRNPLPSHLERREEIIPGEARLCPCCGEARCVIGYEEKEILDLEPVKYFVRVIKREKLACRKCPDEGVATATAGGPPIIEKGKLSDAMVVDIVIKKFGSHLPVYRQQADLERDFGVSLSRSTLNSAILAVGDLLTPVVKTLKAGLIAGGYIQADETPIGVQSAESEGRNHQAYEFQYSRPGGPVVFDFQMSRGRDGPGNYLKNYHGILQCDGYAGYDKAGGSGMVRAGCMAHARRKFHDALKVDPKDQQAASVIAIMAKLYALEKEAREGAYSAEQRAQLRQSQSRPIAEALELRMKEIAATSLPSSKLGQACANTLKQWPRLIVYLDYGVIEIDQNACENAMRPVALGRKNWIHIGSEEAGPKIAAILSIFATCKRLGINLRDYLNEVLPKLPTWPIAKVEELSPTRWKSA